MEKSPKEIEASNVPINPMRFESSLSQLTSDFDLLSLDDRRDYKLIGSPLPPKTNKTMTNYGSLRNSPVKQINCISVRDHSDEAVNCAIDQKFLSIFTPRDSPIKL